MGTKRKVVEAIPACQLMLGKFPTQATLNVLPLGSYDLLVSMDWLATHKAKLDCYHKTLECVNKEGQRITQRHSPMIWVPKGEPHVECYPLKFL